MSCKMARIAAACEEEQEEEAARPESQLACSLSIDSARRRLFSPSLVQHAHVSTPTPTSAAGEGLLWLFEGSNMEGSASRSSLSFSSAPMSTTTSVAPAAQEVAKQPAIEGEHVHFPAMTPSPVEASRRPPAARAASEPRASPRAAMASADARRAAGYGAVGHGGGGARRCHSAARTTATSGRGVKESPPRGCVAEKVSIFEQRCQTPKHGGMPAVLRRGPNCAPVPTPLGSGRRLREETAQHLQKHATLGANDVAPGRSISTTLAASAGTMAPSLRDKSADTLFLSNAFTQACMPPAFQVSSSPASATFEAAASVLPRLETDDAPAEVDSQSLEDMAREAADIAISRLEASLGMSPT